MIGQKVGNYSVVRLLGQGGMGQVFEAVHDQLRRRAAIKVLLPEFSKHPEVVARFFNEALAVNVVQHPSIVSVYESGTLPDGGAYIVMEFLDGTNLQSRIDKQGALPEYEALLIARQIASALAAAHAKEIIHRDLKAENVMLVQDPEVPGGKRVKILDFGLAKVTAKHQGAQAVATKDGVIMGTPSYMPPEQWMSATMADAKTDVYALGVMLYLMLAGRYPFIGDNVNQLMMKHMYEEAVPIRQIAPTVSAQTVALVDALLSKTQKSRPNMGEVSARIEKILPSISATAPSSAAPAKFVSEIQSAPTRYGDDEGPAAATAGNPAVQATAIQGDIAAAAAGNLAWTNLQIDAADPTKMVPAAKMPTAVAEPRRAMPVHRQAGGPSNPWIKYAVLGACILLALLLIVRLVR